MIEKMIVLWWVFISLSITDFMISIPLPCFYVTTQQKSNIFDANVIRSQLMKLFFQCNMSSHMWSNKQNDLRKYRISICIISISWIQQYSLVLKIYPYFNIYKGVPQNIECEQYRMWTTGNSMLSMELKGDIYVESFNMIHLKQKISKFSWQIKNCDFREVRLTEGFI